MKLSDYENEKGIVFSYSSEKDTLFNHLLKSINLSMKSLGRHKIPLMGGAWGVEPIPASLENRPRLAP